MGEGNREREGEHDKSMKQTHTCKIVPISLASLPSEEEGGGCGGVRGGGGGEEEEEDKKMSMSAVEKSDSL